MLIYFARYSTKRQGIKIWIKWAPALGNFPESDGAFSLTCGAFSNVTECANCIRTSLQSLRVSVLCSCDDQVFTWEFAQADSDPGCQNWACELIVCFLYVQKEPRVLIAFIHPPSTSFPSEQLHKLKANNNYDKVIISYGENWWCQSEVCTRLLKLTQKSLLEAGKTSFRNMFYIKETTKIFVCPDSLVIWAQNKLSEISPIRALIPCVGLHAPSSEPTQMPQCHMSATMNHLEWQRLDQRIKIKGFTGTCLPDLTSPTTF